MEEKEKFSHEVFNSKEDANRYLDLLIIRIDENRKLMNKLILFMVFSSVAFFLLKESKLIIEAIGPFKIKDNPVALSVLSLVFSYSHYRHLFIWYDLIIQKNISKNITAKIFGIKEKSVLNESISHFWFSDKLNKKQFVFKNKFLGFIEAIIYLPLLLFLAAYPFLFEWYSLYILIKYLLFDNFYEFLICLSLLIVNFSIIILIYKTFRDRKKRKILY